MMDDFEEQTKKSNRSRHINNLFAGVFLLLSIFLTYAIYLLFWPVTVLKPNVQPYAVVNKQIKAGDNLVYIADTCKLRDVTGFVRRTFVIDRVEYGLVNDTGLVKKGCAKTNVIVPVPNNLPLGKGYMAIDLTYRVNFLKNVYMHLRTEDFEVIP